MRVSRRYKGERRRQESTRITVLILSSASPVGDEENGGGKRRRCVAEVRSSKQKSVVQLSGSTTDHTREIDRHAG